MNAFYSRSVLKEWGVKDREVDTVIVGMWIRKFSKMLTLPPSECQLAL